MNKIKEVLNDIRIRTTLKPCDLGYVIYRHGKLYGDEYNYDIVFEIFTSH